MRKIKYILSIILILIIGLTMTSCGGFITDYSVEIESIEAIPQNDGSTKIIIKYTDEELSNTEFVIPKGEDGKNGKDGIGISGIDYETMSDGGTKVIISFSNKDMPNEEIILKGQAYVTNVEYKVDQITKNTLVYFHFSNGFVSEPIRVMKGEDGAGITNIKSTEQEDGSVKLEIILTNDSKYNVTIPAPLKGDDGNGIKSIVSYEDDNFYYIEIEYTKSVYPEVLRFNKPTKPNTWYSGSTTPDKNQNINDARNGDYYFDLYHNTIYVMQNNKWETVVDFDSELNNEHKITFNLNDSTEAPASMPGDKLAYYVTHGEYFSSCGDEIPVPTRDGYTFAGWTTDRTVTPTTSYLTKLTTICSDLTFYAQWIKN